MKKQVTFLARAGLPALFAMLFGLSVFAQSKSVTGKVTDAADGSPLPGVTVTVKGSTVAAQTQADGSFRIEVPQSARTLVFSFVGHQTQEVDISNASSVSIK